MHKAKVDAKAVQYGLARNMQEAIEAVKEQDSTLTDESIERISPVNLLTSSYDKPNGVIQKWINEGLLIGSDKKKALAYATTNRVQFPTVVQQINKSLINYQHK